VDTGPSPNGGLPDVHSFVSDPAKRMKKISGFSQHKIPSHIQWIKTEHPLKETAVQGGANAELPENCGGEESNRVKPLAWTLTSTFTLAQNI